LLRLGEIRPLVGLATATEGGEVKYALHPPLKGTAYTVQF
jgi:hypothetical protein